MKKELRRAGFVSLTLGALGCGEPTQPARVDADELFRKDGVAVDSLQGQDWRKFLDAKELHRAWAPPSDSPWRPFYKPTLIAAVSVVQSAAMPLQTSGAKTEESLARRLAEELQLGDAAVFVDLPGELSVVWGAALRKSGLTPVVTFNNWPHQAGLLRLERPLGALIYYASEMAGSPRVPASKPAFLLERSRLGQKGLSPSSGEFDNRYFHAATDFPSALTFKNNGIGRIIYVNPRGTTPGCEEDDLNEYFVELSRAGLTFTYVLPGESRQMAAVTPASKNTIFTKQAVAEYKASPTYHHHYYHSYPRYSYWHSSYWTRSSGAWGGSGSGYSSGGSSGYSSGSSGHSSGSSGFSS